MPNESHGWKFRRLGGTDQVILKSDEDIAHLSELDPKLWAALAMPAQSHNHKDVLALLDTDHDGMIRIPEILAAVEHLNASLTSLNSLFEETAVLPLEHLKDDRLRDVASFALKLADTSDRLISLGTLDTAIASFNTHLFNGDGIILPESSEDPSVAETIRTLLAIGYSTKDSTGRDGITHELLDTFIADLEAWYQWQKEGEALHLPIPEQDRDAALAAFSQLRDAVDDYFRRCALAHMAESPDILKNLETQMALALSNRLDQDDALLRMLPLAFPRLDGTLHIDAAFNPLFESPVQLFFSLIKDAYQIGYAITRAQWESIASDFLALKRWIEARPATGVSKLSSEMRQTLFHSPHLEIIRDLIEQDLAEQNKAVMLSSLRALLFLKRDFIKILRNFVNMDEFYGNRRGMFQSGRLFIDGKELELCIDVHNPTAHAAMAMMSGIFLIYCDISRTSGEKGSIVAALTAGSADYLYVGRNALFIDKEGRDWNAVVTRIVIQPINIREAFFSPYKWLVRTIEDLAAKRASAAESARLAELKGTAQQVVEKPTKAAEAAVPPLTKKIDVGTVAAIGVALGSIGAMVTSILSIFIGLGPWLPLGIVGILLLISGPSMILAAMKLRKRDLSPVLNAEGWAINGRLILNMVFGATLSHVASLPPNSSRLLGDPYAPRRKPWGLYLLIAVVIALLVAWLVGWLNPVLTLLKR